MSRSSCDNSKYVLEFLCCQCVSYAKSQHVLAFFNYYIIQYNIDHQEWPCGRKKPPFDHVVPITLWSLFMTMSLKSVNLISYSKNMRSFSMALRSFRNALTFRSLSVTYKFCNTAHLGQTHFGVRLQSGLRPSPDDSTITESSSLNSKYNQQSLQKGIYHLFIFSFFKGILLLLFFQHDKKYWKWRQPFTHRFTTFTSMNQESFKNLCTIM
jgi:hypothetical protein